MTAPTDDAALIADLHLRFRSPYQIDEATCRRAADRLEELQAELAAKNTAGEACMTALAAALERERMLREDNDILRATCTAREEYAADIAALRADAERMRTALKLCVDALSCRGELDESHRCVKCDNTVDRNSSARNAAIAAIAKGGAADRPRFIDEEASERAGRTIYHKDEP